ncbi:glycosyltransferase family 2 protein [Nitrosomonas sp. Is24]|uniref:glycosyltransferase family 2 protein n=1 Tax=Nitrosomonas sp. Is24 TaxID=3080533 RepID=UPI00294B50FC|nr:glycosyltransferase family 2 protein [Nitrosomonas sp. Is24]MDV6340560.1 glycosyltransferase family 2 protein [Nitrosomonas sp. Is24]
MTSETAAPIIDVVIPVYNAAELTKRCIDSVIDYLGSSIRTIHIQDDASGAETRAMLDNLSYPQLHVYHAPENQGYGKSVNDSVARSDADWVLVLNSDIEVLNNFLPWLCGAFAADPQLAVISPMEGDSAETQASRYVRQPGGYIATYRFRGYAFLIRRAVFQMMGGFDAQFGRGYYEDTDLGRRLDQQGWRMGVHPDATVRHETGASFGRGKAYRELVQHNRSLYLSRYPLARQNVLTVSGNSTLTDLPSKIADPMEQVMRQGGRLHWLTPAPLPQLSCLQMRNGTAGFKTITKLMLRGWLREDKRINAVWILPGVSAGLRILLTLFVRLRRLEMREWQGDQRESAQQQDADKRDTE